MLEICFIGYDELARQYKKPASDDENELSEGEIDSTFRSGFGSQQTTNSSGMPFGTKSSFQMPELVHNINKIVSSLEQQIIKADQTWVNLILDSNFIST